MILYQEESDNHDQNTEYVFPSKGTQVVYSNVNLQ